MYDMKASNLKYKLAYCMFFLGLLPSSSLATTPNNIAIVPTNCSMANYSIPSWEGLYISGKYSGPVASEYADKRGNKDITVTLEDLKSQDTATLGVDNQYGNLVYGILFNADSYFTGNKPSLPLSNLSLSTALRAGLTFNNNESSILQNSLLYGFLGVRAKNLPAKAFESISNMETALKDIRKDKFIGLGLEKKITSFLSINFEYRHTFNDFADLKAYSQVLKNNRFSTGLSIRL